MLRAGIDASYSCKSGACQTCMLRAVSGSLTPASQRGLRDSLKRSGYFLACVCRPVGDMEISAQPPDDDVRATIANVERLSSDVVLVTVETPTPFDYFAGQYAVLIRQDGLKRSYSIANVPGETRLEFHVKLEPGGRMSQWLNAPEAVGAEVVLRGPAGECRFRANEPNYSLLLAGTGTGLGPLYGIACEAIRSGHKAPIHLFHAAGSAEGLYMHARLRSLAAEVGNFHYHPVTRRDSEQPGFLSGNLETLLALQMEDVKACRAYLCGNPDFVRAARRNLFQAGLPSTRIHADAFLTTAAKTP
jgi:NAD(P)H-flavin reductase